MVGEPQIVTNPRTEISLVYPVLSLAESLYYQHNPGEAFNQAFPDVYLPTHKSAHSMLEATDFIRFFGGQINCAG